MKIAPTIAATNRHHEKLSPGSAKAAQAAALPTSTGASAAGSVRGLAAIAQVRRPFNLGPAWELREVGRTMLLVGVPALLTLLAHVEEQRRVVGELLQAGDPVLGGVERRLQEPQRE